MAKYDETDIVRRLQAGDEQVFRQFMAQYKKKAYSIAYGLTGNHHDATGLSQEAFVRFYFSIKKFKGKSSLYTWFYRILINLWLRQNQQNRAGRYNLFFTGNKKEAAKNPNAVDPEKVSSPGDRKSDPAKHLLDKELRMKIDQAVQSLPESQKTVFVLRQIKGLSIEQTAEVLGSRPGTVKSHLFRAVRKLRKLLLPYLKA